MMPRKKLNTITSPFAFGISDMNDLSRDATYVIKWNAPLAIQWMEGIAGRFLSEYEKEVYNKSVTKINNYLDHLEKMRYYDKKEVWGALAPARLSELF
jgi:hypothetical protein|tara:strand:+ start:489 stop:782 length:294 start_codon:yes stop_codon:yes gene_type:complete